MRLRDVPPFFDFQGAIAAPVQHERRHVNRRQHVPDVDFRIHAREGDRCSGLAPIRR